MASFASTCTSFCVIFLLAIARTLPVEQHCPLFLPHYLFIIYYTVFSLIFRLARWTLHFVAVSAASVSAVPPNLVRLDYLYVWGSADSSSWIGVIATPPVMVRSIESDERLTEAGGRLIKSHSHSLLLSFKMHQGWGDPPLMCDSALHSPLKVRLGDLLAHLLSLDAIAPSNLHPLLLPLICQIFTVHYCQKSGSLFICALIFASFCVARFSLFS